LLSIIRCRIFREAAQNDGERVLFQPPTWSFPRPSRIRSLPKNAHRLQTRILCEGANGPCTSMADDIVDRKGIFVIPDILPTPAV